jgi:transglutaminase-like putative cysteine protease
MKSRPKTICIYVSLLGIALLVGGICWWTGHVTKAPSNARITIRYNLEVQNTSNRPLNQAKISVLAPVYRTATQQCNHIQTSHPHRVKKNPLGNQALEIQWDLFAPLSTKMVSVRSDLALWRRPQKYSRIEKQAFLEPEPLIESEDPDIQSLAKKLASKTTHQTVRSIFDWVAGHIQYSGYVKKNRGARYALTHRKGDCTEYASLFVALCRANGIPARPIGGFVCPRSMVVDVGDYHNWAEFYMNGRWRIADPQNNQLMTEESNYIAFDIMRPCLGSPTFLVSKLKGAGLKVKFKRRKYSRK